jgi:competence ComEA-like helix-hairpin-helix protein
MGVRALDALRPALPPTAEERRALEIQIARVDSARRGLVRGKGRTAGRRNAAAKLEPEIYRAPTAAPSTRVDLDTASLEEIEKLPWIGPVLAQRIVANRDRCGAFGSLDALKRVSGIGDRTAARLAPYVTFSKTPRPLSAAPLPECQRTAGRTVTVRHGRT